jgi:hypothetical protein
VQDQLDRFYAKGEMDAEANVFRDLVRPLHSLQPLLLRVTDPFLDLISHALLARRVPRPGA